MESQTRDTEQRVRCEHRPAESAPLRPSDSLPWGRRVPLLGLAAFLCSVAVVALDLDWPVVRLLAGAYLLIGLPALLVRAHRGWRSTGSAEAWLYSVTFAVLAAMLVPLLANTVLPRLGVSRPLDLGPLLCLQVALCVALGLVVRERLLAVVRAGTARPDPVSPRPGPGPDTLIRLLGALLVPAAVAGAIRLNNGLDAWVTAGMLLLAGALLVVMLVRAERLTERTILWGLYLVALAMLLMTSLRGWFITGHDIQREYRVFGLTFANGDWDIARYQDAYNACMSITLLPNSIVRLMGIDGTYAFKAAIPVLFAMCVPMVYLIGRRFTSRRIALFGAGYFVAFPTYFTDMPFLTRQEVAFVFLGALLLVATNPDMSRGRRRWLALVFAVGVIISHYSTTYVFIGVLAASWFVRLCAVALRRWRARRGRPSAPAMERPVFGPTFGACVVVLTVLWTGPITHTGGHLEETAAQVVSSFSGAGVRSSDVAYNLFSTSKPSLTQRLADYRAETLQTRNEAGGSAFYPVGQLDQYRTPIVGADPMPLTGLGSVVAGLGIPVPTLNAAIRQVAARLLQVFVFVGLILVALGRTRLLRPSPEFFHLAAGSFLVVFSQVVLPSVSVSYGILRAFQQSLFVMGPFLVVGSVFLFRWLRGRAAEIAPVVVFGIFFASLTGLLPQALGGYPPQLHLNNAGTYYNDFYLHPEERVAIEWLQDRLPAESQRQIQSEVATDRYTFGRVRDYAGLSAFNDIYPTLIRRNAYIFLGFGTTTEGRASLFYQGDVLTYRYPIELLDSVKSRVYSSGGASIYR